MPKKKNYTSTKYYTVAQLMEKFGVNDDRTIRSTFGDNIVVRNEVEVISKSVITKQIKFDIDEPFMSFDEVMKELDIDRLRLYTLEKGCLPYFQLKHSKGSPHLYLVRDVKALKETSGEYHNFPLAYDVYTKNLNKLAMLFAQFDLNHSHIIFKKEVEYDIYVGYFIEKKSIEQLIEETGVCDAAVRHQIGRALGRLEEFLPHAENIFKEYDSMRETNIKLLQKLSEYERLIHNHKNKSNHEAGGVLENENTSDEAAISLCIAIAGISIYDLDLSVRLQNCLEAAKLKSLKSILEYDVDSLMKFRNYGKTSANELKMVATDLGLKLNCFTGVNTITPQNVYTCVSEKGVTGRFLDLANLYKKNSK